MCWEKKLGMLAPIEQASRCLEAWLKSERRSMAGPQKRRAAALLARYFQHEEQVTDQLMLSFLNHYAGKQEVDMEDPASVRKELKAALDTSRLRPPGFGGKRGLLALLLVLAAALGFWGFAHQKITRAQQAELKEMVHRIAELDRNTTHAAIWADVKEPLQVRSYQDITRWGYRRSLRRLEEKLALMGAGV